MWRKKIGNELFFGFVSERIKGVVLGPAGESGVKEFQAVWKIVYDDGDTEEYNRLDILAAIRLYRLHIEADTNKPLAATPTHVEANDGIPNEEADIHPGILSSGSQFLDPRYNLLEMLTPTATQNRLSYLVELIQDKAQKQISNEAIKVRLRKDMAAFVVEDMPTDVRGIARYLGARRIEDITRHLCGNTECSYAWVGAKTPDKFNPDDTCPDCGTPRYKRVGAKLKPRRVFYYFGATCAVEALHRNPVFQAN